MTFECPRWPPDWPEIEAAALRCLRSGQWGQYHSKTCSALELRLAELHQVASARLSCSGTAALEIALRASRIGPGDDVILAAMDYPGNFRTIELSGARPVLVDLDVDSPCIDPSHLEAAAGENVRAVIASHLFGVAADVARLRQICESRDWILIEDACQVMGMQVNGRPAGSYGHVATVSFGGSKLVSAGNGGALLVNSDRLAARIGPIVDRPGETFALGPLQAAVIDPQLDQLDEMNQIRRATAEVLRIATPSRLNRWTWQSDTDENVEPAFYKVAWTAQSHGHRSRIVEVAQNEGLPIGEGFRSMSGCSGRRCRKPVPTPRADSLGETLFVLDHRALLLDPSRHNELADALQRVHDST